MVPMFYCKQPYGCLMHPEEGYNTKLVTLRHEMFMDLLYSDCRKGDMIS